MADLNSAFKRIVPRQNFLPNTAKFEIEDMNDAPVKKRNGGFKYRGCYSHSNTRTGKSNYPNNCTSLFCSQIDTCRKFRK